MDIRDLSFATEPDAEKARQLCIERVARGLDEHGLLSSCEADDKPLVLAVLDANQQIVAGLLGKILRGWLRVDMVWVAKELRGLGYGKALMQRAEEIAIAQGCRAAHLDTYGYQAPEFDKRLGYKVFAELRDYPPGETKFYFKKSFQSLHDRQ